MYLIGSTRMNFMQTHGSRKEIPATSTCGAKLFCRASPLHPQLCETPNFRFQPTRPPPASKQPQHQHCRQSRILIQRRHFPSATAGSFLLVYIRLSQSATPLIHHHTSAPQHRQQQRNRQSQPLDPTIFTHKTDLIFIRKHGT